VAGLVASKIAPKSVEPWISGLLGEVAAAAMILAVCYFLYRGGMSRAKTEKEN